MPRGIVLGAKVTCRHPVEAYGSGYYNAKGTTDEVYFEPGMVGTVGAVNVPSVWRERVSFTCVDFEIDGVKHRCALLNNNIKLLQIPQQVEEVEFPVYYDAQGREHAEF